jgi:hypothetical protein
LANRPLIREQAFGEALDADKLEGSAATRFTSIASWRVCSPCCCASRTCGRGPSRADSVWKNGRARVLVGRRRHAGVPSAGRRQRDRRRPPKLNRAASASPPWAQIPCEGARRDGSPASGRFFWATIRRCQTVVQGAIIIKNRPRADQAKRIGGLLARRGLCSGRASVDGVAE